MTEAHKTKIKICGLFREEDILAVNRSLPDFCGFVFARKSRRFIEKEQAAAFRKILDPAILAVGVFTDAPPEIPAEYAAEGVIDMIQLHGREDEAYLDRLRLLLRKKLTETDGIQKRIPVIQAFSIRDKADIRRASGSSADYILLDNGNGGTGEAFNWDLGQMPERDFFLAGGLSSENVEEAIQKLRPYAVDISSGVETDGYKDCQKIENLVRRIRNV